MGNDNQICSEGHAIKLEVISQKGTCVAGHQVGDRVEFDQQQVKGKICIHALYSILPKVFAMKYDARFPWLTDPGVAHHACPDGNNPVIFKVTRKI